VRLLGLLDAPDRRALARILDKLLARLAAADEQPARKERGT
jgi:hypothetical protein